MPLEAGALKLKLSYFGHLIRADGLEKDFILGIGNGTRSRGRPRRRWLDEICDATNFDLWKLITIARNRENWWKLVRVVTKDCYRSDGTLQCDKVTM